MKIHSDTLTVDDLYKALPSGCHFALHIYDGSEFRVAQEGSRSRKNGFIVRMSGSSKHTMDTRNLVHSEKSATYEEWGMFLATLLRRDPNAICGHYKGVEDFNEKTKFAFV